MKFFLPLICLACSTEPASPQILPVSPPRIQRIHEREPFLDLAAASTPQYKVTDRLPMSPVGVTTRMNFFEASLIKLSDARDRALRRHPYAQRKQTGASETKSDNEVIVDQLIEPPRIIRRADSLSAASLWNRPQNVSIDPPVVSSVKNPLFA